MIVFAIDPGSEQSAYVLYDGERVLDHCIMPNEFLMRYISRLTSSLLFDIGNHCLLHQTRDPCHEDAEVSAMR